MIYTSYLGNIKNIPEDMEKISIMRFTPEWANDYIDKIDLKLAPTEDTLIKYKNGKISKSEYIEEFNSVLKAIPLKTIKKKLDNKVLLCTCKVGDFCHRHLIADYLRSKGIAIEELNIKEHLKNIKVEIIEKLTIKECNKHPDKIYVYGDNLIHKGKAGQAIIRDCPNAFGIPTKKYPDMKYGSFFKDCKEDEAHIMNALHKLVRLSYNGNTIVLPKNGIGTGLAGLGYHAPYLHIKLYSFIQEHFLSHIKK